MSYERRTDEQLRAAWKQTAVQATADQILGLLIQAGGRITASTEASTWRPATIRLTEAITGRPLAYPISHADGSDRMVYHYVIDALRMLEDYGFVALQRNHPESGSERHNEILAVELAEQP